MWWYYKWAQAEKRQEVATALCAHHRSRGAVLREYAMQLLLAAPGAEAALTVSDDAELLRLESAAAEAAPSPAELARTGTKGKGKKAAAAAAAAAASVAPTGGGRIGGLARLAAFPALRLEASAEPPPDAPPAEAAAQGAAAGETPRPDQREPRAADGSEPALTPTAAAAAARHQQEEEASQEKVAERPAEEVAAAELSALLGEGARVVSASSITEVVRKATAIVTAAAAPSSAPSRAKSAPRKPRMETALSSAGGEAAADGAGAKSGARRRATQAASAAAKLARESRAITVLLTTGAGKPKAAGRSASGADDAAAEAEQQEQQAPLLPRLLLTKEDARLERIMERLGRGVRMDMVPVDNRRTYLINYLTVSVVCTVFFM